MLATTSINEKYKKRYNNVKYMKPGQAYRKGEKCLLKIHNVDCSHMSINCKFSIWVPSFTILLQYFQQSSSKWKRGSLKHRKTSTITKWFLQTQRTDSYAFNVSFIFNLFSFSFEFLTWQWMYYLPVKLRNLTQLCGERSCNVW